MQQNIQKMWGWGWLSWTTSPGPQPCDTLAELSIKQIKCAERGMIIIRYFSEVGRSFQRMFTDLFEKYYNILEISLKGL